MNFVRCVCVFINALVGLLTSVCSMVLRIKQLEELQENSVYQNFCMRGCIKVLCHAIPNRISALNLSYFCPSDHVRARAAALLQRALVGFVHARWLFGIGVYGLADAACVSLICSACLFRGFMFAICFTLFERFRSFFPSPLIPPLCCRSAPALPCST